MTSDRQRDARRRQELAEAALRQESIAARALVQKFVAQASERGLRTEPLRAMLMDGRRVATGLHGWYLNKARSVAITPEGDFYSLLTTGSWLSRFTGVTLAPSDPPLVIGRGGRDGETGDLKDFLAAALREYEG